MINKCYDSECNNDGEYREVVNVLDNGNIGPITKLIAIVCKKCLHRCALIHKE